MVADKLYCAKALSRGNRLSVQSQELTAVMSISLVRRRLKPERRILFTAGLPWSHLHYSISHSKHQTDSCGIPLQPTWSVNDLLSSYPISKISSSTLNRLYELSALISPAEGTLEHDILKREMEDLVKLVEAVKLVDASEGLGETGGREQISDGRAEGTGISPVNVQAKANGEVTGSELLRFAGRTSDGFYVVDADRTKY